MENSESASTRRRFLKTTATAAVLGACQTPGPRKEQRPNILFFFPDQHRPDWVEWNRDVPVPTPNLAKLKQSGVDFTNCRCRFAALRAIARLPGLGTGV